MYATLSLAAGASLFELAEWMGSSPEIVAKHYGVMTEDALERGRTPLSGQKSCDRSQIARST